MARYIVAFRTWLSVLVTSLHGFFEFCSDVMFRKYVLPTFTSNFSVSDDGHSFDAVLFYGHESMLIIFEVLLFGVVDLMAKNYVFSAVILFVVMEVSVDAAPEQRKRYRQPE